VAVTGVGVVSGFGWGVPALWNGLCAGETAIRPFDRFRHDDQRTHLAAQVPQDPYEGVLPGRVRASRADRYAIAAAREAVHDIPELTAEAERVGVYFASSTGGLPESEVFYAALLRGKRAGAGSLASQTCNGPGDAVARALGVAGPVHSVSTACASGSMVVGDAIRAIRADEVDVALAGGAESLCVLTYSGFNALRSIDELPCRPFRRDRAGLSLGEGAAVLVLERLDRARARGAEVLALALGEGASCDAQHMTAPDPTGAGAARAIALALREASVPPEAVSLINAHGTGTLHNDVAESHALAAIFGARLSSIPVTSTKALVGHLLGAAGAIEAVATVLCLVNEAVHPMPNCGVIDPALPLDLVIGTPRTLSEPNCALSLSLAFGGANAAVLFARPRGGGDGD
jgi:3-oxoacyl-[acyl-carrier-protein] synthase II